MNHAWMYLVRHGETEWSRDGRHTGRTDIPLTLVGRAEAAALAPLLAAQSFALVLASPLARAAQTCELAGLGAPAQYDSDLVEWDYGDYEGLTTDQIRQSRPGWTLWTEGTPGGETAAAVGRRADRVIERAQAAHGDVICFSHGHLLRVLAARWVGLPAAGGRLFALSAGSLSVLGWERETPVVERWNEQASRPR